MHLQMHSAHTQGAELEIFNFGQVRLPTFTVHNIVRNLLTAQLDQILAHQPERDARHGEFKSRLRRHQASSAANRREYIDDIFYVELGLELIGQIDPVASIDKNVDMLVQIVAS